MRDDSHHDINYWSGEENEEYEIDLCVATSQFDYTLGERTENSVREENMEESTSTCQEIQNFDLVEMLNTMPNLKILPANSCREKDTILNPNQPVNFAYPKRTYGKRERSFQAC